MLAPPAHEVVVFLGPSLPVTVARAILPAADYRPPARKGDGYRLLGTGASTVVLIDGVFHREPSVWPRELLALLDEGVRVYGGSSMGALRAAELAPFGMRGVGTIFEWFRDGVIDGDDEVALHHGDEDSGYRALSIPLVNLRGTLRRAVAEELLSSTEAELLIAGLRARHYPERTWAALLATEPVVGWSAERRQRLGDHLTAQRCDLKADDARTVLRAVAALRTGDAPPPPRRARSGSWIEYEYRGLAAPAAADAPVDEADSRRWFLLRRAAEGGLACPADFAAAQTRQLLTTADARSLDELARRLALTVSELERVLAAEALLSWLLRDAYPAQSRRPFAPWSATAVAVADAHVAAWARSHGIEGSASWVVARGPLHFGYLGAPLAADALVHRRVAAAAGGAPR